MNYLVLIFAHNQPKYSDRQENEVLVGLSSLYASRRLVADDIHSESASQTLDYAQAYLFSQTLLRSC